MFSRFEEILVVNLPDRTDRRRETEIELSKAGVLGAEFFPAIRPPDAGKFRSIGEYGCFLSHLTLLKQCCGRKSILVMEDDIRFAHDFAARSGMVDELPEDWEIFYAGHFLPRGAERGWSSSGLVEVESDRELIATHCYAVNGPAISKLIQGYEAILAREPGHPDGGPMPIDGAMNTVRRQLRLRAFAAVPPLADQRSSRTDIGEKQWFDNSPLLSGAVHLARRLKNNLRKLS
ncbi:MAG: glycosyltransferase family 25 protein [Hyphomicrobiales bacterium]|nr:glycosyltransferase family 25 protein [Hyphomicrobiales bacterium]